LPPLTDVRVLLEQADLHGVMLQIAQYRIF